jgi:hypothetical protein
MAKKSKPPLVTTPKPFVFVLMPFSPDFDDIYKLGIRGAAEDAGAYAARVDEQIFTEGMLERIFNQIAKADVIVAEMSTRNANVFYEVGYAHALGKAVLLITQQADDIPFDLKHRQHIVYGGKISDLRAKLAKSLRWAIAERSRGETETGLSAFLGEQRLPEVGSVLPIPTIRGTIGERFDANIVIHNTSSGVFPGSLHIYLLTENTSVAEPLGLGRRKIYTRPHSYTEEEHEQVYTYRLAPIIIPINEGTSKAYRLDTTLSAIPPGAAEPLSIPFSWKGPGPGAWGTSRFWLKIHVGTRTYEFYFAIEMIEPSRVEAKSSEFNRFAHLTEEPIDNE